MKQSFTINDIYHWYANKTLGKKWKHHSTVDKKMQAINKLSRGEFSLIAERFYDLIVEKIVNGKSIHIKGLGYIFIEKKPRIPTARKVDWYKSNKYKQELLEQGYTLYDKNTGEGEKWIYYLTDPYYLRWQFKRDVNKYVNKFIFKPTANNPKGVLGAKGRLVKANKDNPNLHLIYCGKLNNIT